MYKKSARIVKMEWLRRTERGEKFNTTNV